MAKTTKAGYEKAVARGTVGRARKRYLGLGVPLSNHSPYFLLTLVSSLVSSFYPCSYSKEASSRREGCVGCVRRGCKPLKLRTRRLP